MSKFVAPLIGRAGLGNELFPVLRAADIAAKESRVVLWPAWFQLKIGPILRRERDKRMYWTLFRTPDLISLLRLIWAKARGVPHDGASSNHRYVTVQGMKGYFDGVNISGPEFRDLLLARARRGVLSSPPREPYIAFHVRLGDFSRVGASESGVSKNNTSSPIEWFVARARAARDAHPGVRLFVCSDGDDAELAPLLDEHGVYRSTGRNALDDMVFMSHSVGIVGSRSTFSAWGAFLGDVPMVVQTGGDAYRPHARVWEASADEATTDWDDQVRRRCGEGH
ncbi:dihydroorotase [Microbacterium testaceum StLB037]|uniref:Dihydroorotase n=1 Tax=Microbacterium testaceum (strain StLB037) TaxID=979556 RepID=E8NFE8_MICTS|nr:dihydroorotase [Microbacterium testaceum]BAJ75221.1 dihydroorotase [Microbacterium testaceum StLB037]